MSVVHTQGTLIFPHLNTICDDFLLSSATRMPRPKPTAFWHPSVSDDDVLKLRPVASRRGHHNKTARGFGRYPKNETDQRKKINRTRDAKRQRAHRKTASALREFFDPSASCKDALFFMLPFSMSVISAGEKLGEKKDYLLLFRLLKRGRKRNYFLCFFADFFFSSRTSFLTRFNIGCAHIVRSIMLFAG